MRSTGNQLKLEHREPVPHGIMPKISRLTGRLPKLSPTWVAVLAMLGIGYPFAMFLADSEYFEVKQWVIQGADRISEPEIRWTLGITEESAPNIFAFQKNEAVEMLETLPGIQACRIQKTFPDTVEITLFERVPRLLVVCREEMLVADMEGVLFARAKADDLRKAELPILSLDQPEILTLGDTLDQSLMNQALLYNETLKSMASPLLFQISEYHIEQGVGLSIVLRQGTTLHCGTLPPSQTIPKYESLLQEIPADEPVQYVDLRIESHIPYKLGSPRPALEPAPKSNVRNAVIARRGN